MKSEPVPLSRIRRSGPVRGTDADLGVLVESMRALGQLQEVVLNARYEVVGGRRRLEAAHRLGWSHIRAYVSPAFDDAVQALRAERDENCPGCRVQLTRQEQLELARRLEELENPEAAKRKAAAQAKKGEGRVGGAAAAEPARRGDARDKIGEAVGMSGRTLVKAQAVLEAAQREPDRYVDLAELVSQDGQPVDPVYQEFRARKQVFAAADKDARYAPVAERLTTTRDTDKAVAEYERLRDEQSRDRLGVPLPKPVVRPFNEYTRRIGECVAVVDGILSGPLRDLAKAVGKLRECPHLPAAVSSCVDEGVSMLEGAREGLVAATPYAVCSACGGEGCKACKQGWVTRDMVPKGHR